MEIFEVTQEIPESFLPDEQMASFMMLFAKCSWSDFRIPFLWLPDFASMLFSGYFLGI